MHFKLSATTQAHWTCKGDPRMHRSPHLDFGSLLWTQKERRQRGGVLCEWVYLACLAWRREVENEKHGTAATVRHEWSSGLTFSLFPEKRPPHQREVMSRDNSELIIHVELSRNTAAVQTWHAPLTGCHINAHSSCPLMWWITLIRHRVKFSVVTYSI